MITLKAQVDSQEKGQELKRDFAEIIARVNRSMQNEPTAKPPIIVEALFLRLNQIIDLHLLALPAGPELLALAPQIKEAARASLTRRLASPRDAPTI